MRKNQTLVMFIKAIVAVFVPMAACLIYQNISASRTEQAYKDWPSAEGFVTQVDEHIDSNGRTVYDAEYIFDVPSMNNNPHYGNIENSLTPYTTKDTLTVKYDPDDPDISVPAPRAAPGVPIKELCYILLFVFITLFIFIKLTNMLSKIKVKPPKRYVKLYSKKEPFERGYPVKLSLIALADSMRLSNNGVPLIAGIGFALFGVIAKDSVFASVSMYICSALASAIFIFVGVYGPLHFVNEYYTTLGNYVFYKTVDEAYSRPATNWYTRYDNAIVELCKKMPREKE